MITDFTFVSYDELEDTDLVPTTTMDSVDSRNWENFFHEIPRDQLELMICLFLGLSPQEIVRVLDYPNIARFYNLNAILRSTYRKRKQSFFAYN